MTLIYDEYDDVWLWVEPNNHDTALSPTFDEEKDAVLWKIRIKNIIKEELKNARTVD
jgi:hypothetical protein